MLDIGWNELLIIALVTIIVVGPKELPHVLRTVTQFFRKMRAMASEFQSGLDDLAREAELQELKKSIEKTASTDLAGELEREIDPTGEIDRSVRELETQVKEDPRKTGKSEADRSDKGDRDSSHAPVAASPDSSPSSIAPAETSATRTAGKSAPKKRAGKAS